MKRTSNERNDVPDNNNSQKQRNNRKMQADCLPYLLARLIVSVSSGFHCPSSIFSYHFVNFNTTLLATNPILS